MALLLRFPRLSPFSYLSSSTSILIPRNNLSLSSYPFPYSSTCYSNSLNPTFFCHSYRYYYNNEDGDDDDEEDNYSFNDAVSLFNKKEYYKCHDFLEALWNKVEEPRRTLIHGILQCAVGFHHLFNQNHKGAMMELGEGLCKLRKMNFENGPFHQFEAEISAALDFIYQTQIELAACGDDLCIAMNQSERSYQLLGAYGAGQVLYQLQVDQDGVAYIVFNPERTNVNRSMLPKVKLPTLQANEEHLHSL